MKVNRLSSFVWLIGALLCSATSKDAKAQDPRMNLPGMVFDSLVVYAGDEAFSSQGDGIRYARMDHLAFRYTSNEQILRGDVYIRSSFKGQLRLKPSSDFDILDSLELIGGTYYKFRVRFKNLSESEFVALNFEAYSDDEPSVTVEIPLFPFTKTEVAFYPGSEDLYLGEARKFEIVTNNLDNLILDGVWRSTGEFDYRLVRQENKAFIYIEPRSLGEHTIEVPFSTKRPFIGGDGNPAFDLTPSTHTFNVRNSRHVFLRLDKREIIRDPKNPQATEVQIENNRRLQIGKTYRIEASEEVGTPLIAELFTSRRLTNDRVVCELRPYRDHRIQDGFLFIKDGDNPVFMTNVEITPTPSISSVTVLRHGGEWTTNLSIKPGEIIDVRIEGSSLKKAQFFFDELQILSSDSVTQSDIVRNYRIEVPVNINKREQILYDGNNPTGIAFRITEHQRPRQFDFIFVNYGEGAREADLIDQPILYNKTVKDLMITFDRDKIDSGELLYGRQHVQIRVRMEDKDGALIENRNLGSFMICPGERSPRAEFYPRTGCRLDDIAINSYLSRKTHSLADWSRLEIIIEHVVSSYGGEGYSQSIVIYNQRRVTFDVDVSIPAGLITQKIGRGEQLAPLFSGIGFAMVAQFSFYKKGEIQRIQPYKLGAGFLGQNAFNFNPDAERDLGLIVIGSVYPVKRARKLNFPLFAGFGYFLQDSSFFFMVGPGIQVSF